MVEELERVFTIPLKVTKQIPKTKRAPRAIKEIKEYVRRHMTDKSAAEEDEEKGERKDVWLDYKLNELIWKRGIENPPSKVRVKAIRFEDGLIEVSLPDEET
jgi:large subunit ribosomal protein L31e